MVLGVGFLLLVSLIVTTVLEAMGAYLGVLLPTWAPVLQILNLVVSFGAVTTLFAMIFKYLPDAEIAWNDVWLGSFATGLFFMVGKYAIGLYLGRSSIGSAYCAAGLFVVLLVWIYYSAQILFLGPNSPKSMRIIAARIVPAEDAEPVTPEAVLSKEFRDEIRESPRFCRMPPDGTLLSSSAPKLPTQVDCPARSTRACLRARSSRRKKINTGLKTLKGTSLWLGSSLHSNAP